MVSNWVERKVEDVILGLAPIPYADREIVEVGEAILGIEGLPGLPPLHLEELSTGKKALILIFGALPVLDLEYLDLIGLDPFTSAEHSDRGSYVDENGNIVTDGGRSGEEDSYYATNGITGERGEVETANFEYAGSEGQSRGRYTNSNSRSRRGGNSGGGGGKISGILSKVFNTKMFLLGILMLPLLLVAGSQTGYLQAAEDEVGFQTSGLEMDAPVNMMRQGVQTAKCFGNVACMREWRFNNTERPGSEERGEEYSLQLEDPTVNDGYDLDIAYRKANSNVPVSFSVENPRHGLKGIMARDVQYRIKVLDSGTGGSCDTGWMDLSGRYAGGENNILPGGRATPLQQPEALTLEECGLLQPGLGIKNKVDFQVKYNYSSQATLQFEAMSWENMESKGIRPDEKKSVTARTPVKTYVNVESPVTYSEKTGKPIPFSVKLGFETGRDDIEYKVNPEDLTLIDSSETQIATGDIGCEGLDEKEGEDRFGLSEEQKRVMNERQEGQWFNSNTGPSPASCTMELEDPPSISRTGETLTMRVDANYTVRLTEEVPGFKTYNGRCEEQGMECPLLVPESVADGDENLISKCDTSKRLDANNGCGIRKGAGDWTDIKWINGGETSAAFSYDKKVEKGETALLWGRAKARLREEIGGFTYTKSDSKMSSESGIGFDEERWEDMKDRSGVGLVIEGNDLALTSVRHKICEVEGGIGKSYATSVTYDEPLYLVVNSVDCKEKVVDEVGGCKDGVLEKAADWAGLVEKSSDQCQRLMEPYYGCEGTRVWENGRVSCIG